MYGICLDNTNRSYSCYCIDGYTGINCEINWDDCWSNPCLNGGTCNDAVAMYNCTCTEGFVGVNCEQKYSECFNQPCLNNGTCFDYNGFTCHCLEGYSGEFCEIDVSVCNNTICKNSGECIEGPGLSFSCRCLEGWSGELCEEDINECIGMPCQNGGLCINVPASYTCACLFGFTGKDCDKAVVPCETNPCQNDAVCLLEDAQSICYCVPDYHGVLCELRYDDCESKFAQCENGGTCIDGINSFTCACMPEYTGDMCTEYSPTTSTELPDRYSKIFTSSGATDASLNISSTQFIETSSVPTLIPMTLKDDSVDVTKYDIKSTMVFINRTELPSGLVSTLISSFTDHTTEMIDESNFVTSTVPVSEDHKPEIDLTSTESYEPSINIYTTILKHPTITAKTDLEKPTSVYHDSKDTVSTFEPTSDFPDVTDMFPESKPFQRPTKTLLISAIAEETTRKIFTSEITSNYTSTLDTERMSSQSTEYSDESTIKGVTQPIVFTDTMTNMMTVPVVISSTATIPLTVLLNETILTKDQSTQTSAPKTTVLYPFTVDVHNETEIRTTTAESTMVYKCIQEHCANISHCLHNLTVCDCSYQNNCRISPSITNAAFNGKSYVTQHINVDNNGTLQIYARLKTLSKSGILVHAFFDDERYILLYLEAGQLKFQFSCGLQTMLLGEIDSPIDNGYDVDIEMRFQYFTEYKNDKCSARLLVNNTIAMSGEQIVLSHDNVPREARLHLGGIPLTFSHYFPHIGMGFVGCMSLLKVNNTRRDFIYDSMETFQIDECTSFLCLSNPCKNFGACNELHGQVYCKCIAGYVGEICERSVCDDNPCHLGATCVSSPGTGFLCICPLGMHGLFCEEETTVVQPSFSVFVPGVSSYIAYGLSSSIKDQMELSMRLIPHSIEQISLIAYMGQTGSPRDISDHFSITYVRGYIMLTWDLGSGVRRIFTSTPLSVKTHRPHILRVGRRGKEAWLSVDGLGNVTGRSAGAMTRLDVSPILYIGGHKVKNFETLPHDLPLHSGFTGCIFDVELRTEDTVLSVTKSSPATGRGIGECYRNECTRRSCKNGAVCLNHGPTYSCICMKDWEGPDCSIPAQICSPTDPLCHTIYKKES
ncbi:protein eyes shut isoform X2 [Orussus abietinus]|uniref:protein eyes shut isoform X2 n=1 Tax=Orussus abietinus TaxID=222816 RepID=UPI000625441F|nr:protein eyes shut isoform X2 [Orussus abietinus]